MDNCFTILVFVLQQLISSALKPNEQYNQGHTYLKPAFINHSLINSFCFNAVNPPVTNQRCLKYKIDCCEEGVGIRRGRG